jgi:hypothetical protein
MKAQQALDNIHELANLLRNSVSHSHVNHLSIAGSSVRTRLAVQTLRDIEELSELLFSTAGLAADDIIEKIKELHCECKSIICQSSSEPPSLVVESGNDACSLLVQSVKQIERTWAFQYRLWNEKNSLSKEMGCTMEQFT